MNLAPFERLLKEAIGLDAASASLGSSAVRNRSSVSRTMAPVSRTSSWWIFCGRMPAAILVTQEMPSAFMPMWLATMASSAVDIPTTSAPMALRYRISAGVS